MSIITKKDCASAVLGTGTGGCRTIKKFIVRDYLIQKDYKFDKANDTLDSVEIKKLIKKGILVPLPKNIGSTANNKEVTYEEIQKMDIPVSGQVYGWKRNYLADKCLGAALNSLSSKQWNLLQVDEDGELNIVETSDGFIKGFDLNLVNYEGMTDNDGSVSAKLTLYLQLSKTGSIEYGSSWNTIGNSQVNWLGLNGIEEIKLSKTSDGKIQAVFACDESTPVDGLVSANFRVLDDAGVVVPGVTFTENGEGKYTPVGLTVGEDYTIYFYDATDNTAVIAVANYFYKSNRLAFTA